MAITWRNINGPDPSGMVKGLLLAQQGMNNSFDVLNNLVAKREAANQLAEDKAKTNNLEDFYSQVSQQYTTPEALAEAQKSGAIQNLLAGFGDNIDRAAARQYLEQRPEILRSRLLAEQQYQDGQLERSARPIVNRLTEMANSEDKDLRESAKAALGIYGTYGMVPNAGALAGQMLTAERGFAKEGREIESHKDQMNTRALSRAATSAQLENTRLQQEQSRLSLNQAKDEAAARESFARIMTSMRDQPTTTEDGMPIPGAYNNALLRETEGLSPVAQQLVQDRVKSTEADRFKAWADNEDATGFVGSTPLNPTSVIDALAPDVAKITSGDPTEVMSTLAKRIRKGYTATIDGQKVVLPIPYKVAKAALDESDTNWFFLNRGGRGEDIIEKWMQRPEVQQAVYKRMLSENLRGSLYPQTRER